MHGAHSFKIGVLLSQVGVKVDDGRIFFTIILKEKESHISVPLDIIIIYMYICTHTHMLEQLCGNISKSVMERQLLHLGDFTK